MRKLDNISQFTTDIGYVPVAANIPEDTLSRIEAFQMPQTISFKELAAVQRDDKELTQLSQSTEPTSLQLKKVRILSTDVELHCEESEKGVCPYIPASFGEMVLQSTRNLAHTGAAVTAGVVAKRYMRPNIKKKDCRRWAQHVSDARKLKLIVTLGHQPETWREAG